MLLCIFYTALAVLGLGSSASALSSCGCGGLSVPVRAELRAVRHTSKNGALTIDGCPGHVSWKDAPFPNALEPEEPSRVHWLRSLFTQQEAASVVRLLDDQIGYLRKMESEGVYENQHRGFGVRCGVDEDGDSITWCNFGTEGFVECACAGSIRDDDGDAMSPLSAEMLVLFFECGQRYE